MLSIISRTIVITAISIFLAAPLAWGGCNDDGCNEKTPSNQAQEPVPASATPAGNPHKPRARDMNISDLVTGEQNPGSKNTAPVPQNAAPGAEKRIKKLLEPKKDCED